MSDLRDVLRANLFDGEWTDPVTGRCAHCVGRTTSLLGCATNVAFVIAVALAIALVGWLAAPRGASGPVPPQALAFPEAPPAAVISGPAAADAPRQPSGGASLTEARTQALGAMVAAQHTRMGDISHMGDYPVSRDYLAIPCQRNGVHCGLLVRLCGPADCRVMRQTDYGPSQQEHPDRIADVHPAVFEELCGVPARLGLCPGTWTAVTPTLPPTDEEP